MYGPPANLALVLPIDTPIRTIADLKGKRIGVTTAGSLTDWLVRELSRQQGWGSDGMQILALGEMQARLAAIQRGELDGMVIEAATGYELEEAGKAKNFLLFGDIAKDFYTHVIFASDDLIEKRPDLLGRFLRGWFKTIAFMRGISPRASHRSGLDTLASSGSCHRTKAAAFHCPSGSSRCRLTRPRMPRAWVP